MPARLRLSVIIAAYNEERTVAQIVKWVREIHARIWEVPITYSGRTYPEGKKIGWRDGVAALFHIIRFYLFPPAPRPAEVATGERAQLLPS